VSLIKKQRMINVTLKSSLADTQGCFIRIHKILSDVERGSKF